MLTLKFLMLFILFEILKAGINEGYKFRFMRSD